MLRPLCDLAPIGFTPWLSVIINVPFTLLGKLLAVKSVVFFTYFQSCGIALLHW